MTTLDVVWNKFRFRKDDTVPYYARDGKREQLIEVFAELEFKRGAEIGVSHGLFSEFMAKTIPNLELFSIDPYERYYMASQERVEGAYNSAKERFKGFTNVNLIRKRSLDAVKDFQDKSLDFVYIDGSHRFNSVATDLIFWSRKVKIGGIVSGHDYYKFYQSGVVEAVDSFTKCNNIKQWFLTREATPSFFWIMDEAIYRNCYFE